jgi:hypothetical protein
MDRFGRSRRYNIAPKPARIDTAPWRVGDPIEPAATMFVPIDESTWVTDFSGYAVRARMDYEGDCCDGAPLVSDEAVVGGLQGTYLSAEEGDYLNHKRNETIHGLHWQLMLPSAFTEGLEPRALCLTVQFQAAGSPNWKTAFVYRVPAEYGC